jgi:serine protease Do/serine protease DegQ
VGIGFAVPSVMVKAVVDQIVRFGEVRRGRLGASSEDITHDLAASLGLASTAGAIVSTVDAHSPAEKAGLKAGDVITAVNGRNIRSSLDLRNKIGLMPIGETVTLDLIRNGKPLTTRVKIAKPLDVPGTEAETVPQLAGATVANFQSRSAQGSQGVVVTKVDANSPAWMHGLRPGDIIVGVNRKKVRSVQEFLTAVQVSQDSIILSLLRGDFRLRIMIR